MPHTPVHILVIDDETNLLEVIRAYLEKEGYRVSTVENGTAGLRYAQQQGVDLVILDLMLPDLSGEEICTSLRQTSQVPILMLTAKTAESSRVSGLNMGADDYLTKPFSPRELVARVKAILRRSSDQPMMAEILRLTWADLEMNRETMTVCHQGQQVDLTSTEFRMLWLLASHPGQVFSRDQLVNLVMGDAYEGYDRTIDVHMKNLRQKLKDRDHALILTVYGAGYKLRGELP